MKVEYAFSYADSVLSGEISACKTVKQACQRFVNDLENPELYFDPESAQHAIDFFYFLKHIKGEWAKTGKHIELEPWQCFITANMFGWKLVKNNMRRFRTVYIEVPRKNAKTTMAAGWAGYLFFADGEQGAEIYSCATSRDQAKIVHGVFTAMVKKNAELRRRISVYKNNLSIDSTFSKFEPLSSDFGSLDGLSTHGSICDEVHQWPQRGLWDVIETSTGSRAQSLQIAITTAGSDREGICYELHDYIVKVLNGSVKDESFFGIIYSIDEDDNWQDPKIWAKSNPNLGVSIYQDDMERKALKAAEIPAAQNNFLRKHLNVWTQQVTRWIDIDLWDANHTREVDPEKLSRHICYGGIDLSSVQDLTCWVMLFPDKNNPDLFDLIMRCWCPESRLYDTKNRYRDQYQAWEKQGFLSVTDGNAIDYDFVRAAIVKDAQKYNIHSIGIDRLFQGYEFAMKLNEELGGSEKKPLVFACGMGFMSMGGPCQELERRLLEKGVNHGGNPILKFMADSVAVSTDPAGNKKPSKDKSQGKIDGIVSILLAIDRILRSRPLKKIRIPKAV